MSTQTVRTEFVEPVAEKSDRTYRTILTLDDAPAAAANISDIKATLIDVDAGTVLIDDLSVKNANGGVMEPTSGILTLALTQTHNTIQNDKRPFERRLLTLHVTYNGGNSHERHEVLYYVQNLQVVT